MRKKLDTRFPAARIKKIMQTDEDVGKIAMAVPLLVSKALELFLQDLCDRTYEITLRRGAKTLNSMHLKQCVQSFNVFDFLRDIVGKVPDFGGSDATGDDRSSSKRRKVADDDHNAGDDDDLKRDKSLHSLNSNGGGRGRGRGRSRGRGRISRAEKESNLAASSLDSDSANKQKPVLDSMEDSGSKRNDIHISSTGMAEDTVKVRNFDLNLDLDENGDTPAISPPRPLPEPEYPGWSLAEMGGIDPVQLANLNSGVGEDEEDYDE